MIDESVVKQRKIIYDNFPQVPWKNDTFSKWVTETGFANIVSYGSMVANDIYVNPLGIIPNTANIIQQTKNHILHSTQLQGMIGNAGMNYYNGEIGFRVTQYSIKPEFMQKIDNYFTRYGYRVNDLKTPNIRGRAYVNYVKTHNAKISGNVPVNARETLENAMNHGCSFWHRNDMMLPVYDNPIVGE